MRVVAMAGRVSGSSVRTQNRFCGLWMGCTVGLSPPGEGPDGGRGERPTVGRGAPWWPARESRPGLGVGSGRTCRKLPGFSRPPLVRRGIRVSWSSQTHSPNCTGEGPRVGRGAPAKARVSESGPHHAGHGESHCWNRPWQQAQALRPPLGKCRIPGPACGSPRTGPAPAPGPGEAQRMRPQAPMGPTLPRTPPPPGPNPALAGDSPG